ncbi:MAG: sensor histidine kinase [bacterium]
MSEPNTRKPWQKWLFLFAIFTLIAVLNLTRFVTSELAEGEPGKFQFYLIMETTGAYAVMLLLTPLLWFFRKYRLTRDGLSSRLPVYLLVSMIFGACHTLLMFGSRSLIFWLGGKGSYDYGHLPYRFLMEYTHQFFAFWSIWAIVLLIDYVRENQRQKLRAAELEQQLSRARLQTLQMQLNPHFLFNTLNVISSTMYDDVKAADHMIANLSDLLRKTLNHSNWQEHPLEKELELLELYVDIMKARFHDKLSVKMNIAREALAAKVPGFILQPLVENSIRYSMETLQTTEIEIRAQTENGRMKLVITDNGPGLPAAPAQIMKNGVGLSNTAERLEKLYGREHRLHLQNIETGGLQVVMEIPYRIGDENSV